MEKAKNDVQGQSWDIKEKQIQGRAAFEGEFAFQKRMILEGSQQMQKHGQGSAGRFT